MVYKKKKFSKKMVRYRKSSIPYILPTSHICRLRYIETFTMNAGSATVGKHLWLANSVYDPNSTGTGDQPLGFDQLALIYNKYVVLGSKIRATFMSNSEASSSIQRVGIGISSTTGTISGDVRLMQKGTRYKMLGPQTSRNGIQIVSNTYSAKKFRGVKSAKLLSNQLALTTENPSELIYFTAFCSGIGADDPSTIECQVQIDYVVQFRDLRLLSGS